MVLLAAVNAARKIGEGSKASGPQMQLLDFAIHPARKRLKLWLKIIHE
ncbi:MAG TPA: hypothetical protein VGC19_04715 [Rhodanobacter sp.]